MLNWYMMLTVIYKQSFVHVTTGTRYFCTCYNLYFSIAQMIKCTMFLYILLPVQNCNLYTTYTLINWIDLWPGKWASMFMNIMCTVEENSIKYIKNLWCNITQNTWKGPIAWHYYLLPSWVPSVININKRICNGKSFC